MCSDGTHRGTCYAPSRDGRRGIPKDGGKNFTPSYPECSNPNSNLRGIVLLLCPPYVEDVMTTTFRSDSHWGPGRFSFVALFLKERIIKYMPHTKKIVVLVILILFVVFIILSLKTETAEAPEMKSSDPSETSVPGTTEVTIPPTSGVTLDLSNQGIAEVSRSVFDKTDTEVLNLSGNKLTSLQAEVRQLSKLRVLDLSSNNLTNIPAELGQLSNLEILDLSSNKLTGLPYELGNLKNLKTLDLRGNNYAVQDLSVIQQSLPSTAVVLTD